jgi:DNA topoisomerase-1
MASGKARGASNSREAAPSARRAARRRGASQALRAAALRHVNDAEPGIRRHRAGKGFTSISATGRRLRDQATLGRIRALAIPPAWTEVWICRDPSGHLQATGRDARGRKQYRYHPRWSAVRDAAKYARLTAFARALPAIRRRVRKDLKQKGLPRTKVLAILVRLLEDTLVRIGNEEYARENGSYGLTTMQDRHAKDVGQRVRLRFRGKSGTSHDVRITDARVARLVKRCRELPGQRLFQYIDDEGSLQPVGSGDINAYLREITGADFTAKDFRTWGGTVLATAHLPTAPVEAPPGPAARRAAVEGVAEALGNTVAICRKCYIHPAVLRAFEDEDTLRRWLAARARPTATRGLTLNQRSLLAFLRGWERRRDD